MSKFLKVIVNLVVLFSIVIAAALLVPPFIGIDTVMNDNLNTETNIPVGSVAYGEEIKIKDLKKKDKIIYTEGSNEYVYEIVAQGADEGTYEVKDPYRKGSDTEVVTLQKAVPKVVVVVPFIGYAAIALQTKEGLIVVGLGIVFLIILFILSELWRKDDDDDDEYDEDEEEYEDDDDEEEELSRKERRRLKKEEKRRRKEEKRRQKEEDDEEYEDEDEEEEEVLTRKEKRRLKKEEKRRRKLQKKGLLEEDEEEEESELLKPVEVPQNTQQDEELQGFDEAMKEAMSSIALGITESGEEASETVAVMEDSVEETEMIEEKLLQEENEVQEEEPVSSIEKVAEEETQPEAVETIPVNADAIPKTPTIQELLDQVQAAGETPEVKKDKENKITLLDYSDIL